MIKEEFTQVIKETKIKLAHFPDYPSSLNEEEVFKHFKKLKINPEYEGIAWLNGEGKPKVWLGKIVDLEPVFSEIKNVQNNQTLLIRHKASHFLIFAEMRNKDEFIVFFRLLFFDPQLKTPYIKAYQFLKPKLLQDCHIDYWDFREDVSGFERIFLKHKDEYIAKPELKDEGAQTIFFPLRNEKNKLMATVTLNSSPRDSHLASERENLAILLYLFLCSSLFFLLIYFLRLEAFTVKKNPQILLLSVFLFLGMRFFLALMSRLEKIQSLSFFSPENAGFISFWTLTKSPADIFLTFLILFLILKFILIFLKPRLEKIKKKISFFPLFIINLALILGSFSLIFFFQKIVSRIVFHSNLSLIRFSLNPSFILLQLSILLLFLGVYEIVSLGISLSYSLSRRIFNIIPSFLVSLGAYFIIFKKPLSFSFLLEALLVFLVVSSIFFEKKRKRAIILISFLVFTLYISTSIHAATFNRNRALIENTLKSLIHSLKEWGHFFLGQSLMEIDSREGRILSFFKNQKFSGIARTLWERTSLAKSNWYSRLELLDAEGKVLSSFSLNIPELYRLDADLPLSPEWKILEQNISYMGKEKKFLVAYKDWYLEMDHAGRTIVYISVDYEMLPFLYSANPYFELIRVASIPSLEQVDLGFMIFDLKGESIFNPTKISTGIPFHLLHLLLSSDNPVWSSFKDKNQAYDCFYFKENGRIYSLFLPRKNFIGLSTGYLRLVFFYLLVFSLSGLVAVTLFMPYRKISNPFWSFSNRVYLSFFIVAIIPFLMFTTLTRGFFSRIFTQQFTEKAETHARFAQEILKDFIFLQQEEHTSLTMPPENVVLWISSTISNDVNLYQDGKLISSSRREFFDSGLLSEIIDGDIYYKMRFENMPMYTQTQKIGEYSFHTLNIPYFLQNHFLIISLPFPLEKQEISQASGELIEFLTFISIFFMGMALLFARGIGSMIITPIKKLLNGTKQVSLGNLEISITHKGKDEMKTLIDGFNSMVRDLKKHQRELADMSKTVAWAEMARKVAHEIKNPLTPIQLSAEHLLKVFEDRKNGYEEAVKESASYIIKEVENLRKIAQEFLQISKESRLHKEFFNLKEAIQETIMPYEKALSKRIRFEEDYKGKDFNFFGDGAKIKIAIKNIIINSIEAIPEKGHIKTTLSSEEEVFRIEIKDDGVGMKKEVLEKIFEPYYSTKHIGTGLGLPIAKKIIEDHGGSIQATSKEKEGSTILIILPKVPTLIAENNR